jgi:acyl dehydratase
LDKETGELLAIGEHTVICRADGGFGGKRDQRQSYEATPDRAPDETLFATTHPHGAMLYRLNGDYNPLHIDPEFARTAGFARPILHGLCTFGICAAALMRLAGTSAENLKSVEMRFSKPIFPGETILIEVWRGRGRLQFRARIPDRDVTVIDMGQIRMTDPPSGAPLQI